MKKILADAVIFFGFLAGCFYLFRLYMQWRGQMDSFTAIMIHVFVWGSCAAVYVTGSRTVQLWKDRRNANQNG